MTKKATIVACVLALALFVWVPLTAFAAEGAEQDTQTEELEIVSDDSDTNDSSSNDSSSNSATSKASDASSVGTVARTGDESSALLLASLVASAMALLAMGAAIREIKAER